MSRERIVGFLLGVSVGTAVGFYLRPLEPSRRENRPTERPAKDNRAPAASRELQSVAGASRPGPESVSRSGIS